MNALSTSFLCELKETVEQCAIDTEIRVLVIASNLGKVFSAGADIEQIKNECEHPHRVQHNRKRTQNRCGPRP